MSSIADSEVTFVTRAKQYGLSQGVIDSLASAGIKTYSGLCSKRIVIHNTIVAEAILANQGA